MTIYSSGTTHSFFSPNLRTPKMKIPKSSLGSNDLSRISTFLTHSGIPSLPVSLSSAPVRRTIRHSDDSKILTMSDKDYLAAISALGGAWADNENMSDSWLEDIRNEWDERLDYLNDTEPPTDTHI